MIQKVILLLTGGLIFYACATVPVTGRNQLSLISNAEIMPMAQQQYSQVITQGPLSSNAEQTTMIKRVGVNIQKAVEEYMAERNLSSQLNGFAWEFNLIDDPTVNAWCMPGGKVAFYTGILPICKDELGVAVVMGHEVAHAIANHGRERMSQQMVAQVGVQSLGAFEKSNTGQSTFMEAVGAGTGIGMLKFSRQHESEADKWGDLYGDGGLRSAGSATVLEALSGGQASEFFQRILHPKRVRDLNS